MKIGVLITCHNRREKTLKCLQELHNQKSAINYSLDVYLTDDNSTDGTGKAVKEMYPNVTVSYGDGSLYWAGGMRNSWRLALESRNKYDYFLLLNDDTYLFENAIKNLISSNQDKLKHNGVANITIGTTVDKNTDILTYGGYRLRSKKRLRNYLVFSSDSEEECDMGCANIMLVPWEIVMRIGILHDHYTHGIADFDYTLRAKKSGFRVYTAPGILGKCIFDHGKNWKSSNTGLKERIEFLYSPKGLQYKEFIFFIKHHFPLDVPSIFIRLWVKTLFPIIYDKFKQDGKKILKNEMSSSMRAHK